MVMEMAKVILPLYLATVKVVGGDVVAEMEVVVETVDLVHLVFRILKAMLHSQLLLPISFHLRTVSQLPMMVEIIK
jgi:hypothetical protein